MTVIRSILLSLLFSSFVFAQEAPLVPGQIYTTPNVVQPTVSGTNSTPWVNGVYQNNLTCWAWGDPGYCGPNPIVRPGNNINFSFGLTNLYQSQAVASVLPNSGTGLRVDGYNYGFMAKNGNGWDNGQVDYLSAYVSFYDPKGNQVFNKNYNLNYKFDWTSFNFNETFLTPLASKDLGQVQYGFVGGDSNFWAGPYGPEIYNVNFSLKYSIDPCYSNVLSSPTCPGYLEELAKLSAVSSPSASAEISSTSNTATGTVTTTVVADSLSPTVSVSSTAERPQTNAPTASVVTSTTSSSTSSSNSSSVSIGLSVVARNKEREQEIVSQAVQNAISTATSAASESQKEALAIASDSSQASQGTSSSAQSSSQSSQQSRSQFATSAAPAPRIQENRDVRVNSTVPSINTQNTNTGSLDVFRNLATTRTEGASTSISPTFSLLPENRSTAVIATPAPRVEESRPAVTFYSSSPYSLSNEATVSASQSFLTDRTNPINQVLENRLLVQESNVSRTGPSVNKNASNNELAGDVDINKVAQLPAGYNEYLNLVIRDANFYPAKEIYKNQRVVDNVRVLRQLASDRLHQQMVDQQYLPR